jgi:hypothetical protein
MWHGLLFQAQDSLNLCDSVSGDAGTNILAIQIAQLPTPFVWTTGHRLSLSAASQLLQVGARVSYCGEAWPISEFIVVCKRRRGFLVPIAPCPVRARAHGVWPPLPWTLKADTTGHLRLRELCFPVNFHPHRSQTGRARQVSFVTSPARCRHAQACDAPPPWSAPTHTSSVWTLESGHGRPAGRPIQVKMATISPFWKLQRKINQIYKNFTIWSFLHSAMGYGAMVILHGAIRPWRRSLRRHTI